MRKAWGAGYATEGSLALMRRGFREQGVTRVVARAMLGNTGSWHVMEKLGMTRIGEFEEPRFPGIDKRAVKYAMTGAEFAEKWKTR
jgi:RimJ/RimL family protein N-acetyltransferase